MAEMIDGKVLSEKILEEIRARISAGGLEVGLAVVLAGENPASKIYVANKIKACGRCGIKSYAYYLPNSVGYAEMDELIGALNADPKVHGILVQLPLPRQLDERRVLALIDDQKDVDGFSVSAAGKLMTGGDALFACTPSGIIELIKSTGQAIAGKHAVVVGRSNIVGKPAAMLLLREDATVTMAHSKTANLGEITRTADILVAAVGKAEMITGDMIKPGAVVIDVGVNRTEAGLKGDVKFDEAERVAGYITPVPGGVGPMTIAMLLSNTLKACQKGS
ncbi:MAG: bifunctional methylenetetrahydrofolate dehydrogenase/methenyltetrahydrofolate cyclohydrolase FolD [Firmicutes bacterium]|nr:bifunctional methylenetetrahydrofolate dehydrogenase/methenyltetrahydrofolate cyclohydrolase FolD [Bacillota bacterium]